VAMSRKVLGLTLFVGGVVVVAVALKLLIAQRSHGVGLLLFSPRWRRCVKRQDEKKRRSFFSEVDLPICQKICVVAQAKIKRQGSSLVPSRAHFHTRAHDVDAAEERRNENTRAQGKRKDGARFRREGGALPPS
jgi:hypothetical protein